MLKHLTPTGLWLLVFTFSAGWLSAAPSRSEAEATEAAKAYILQLKAGEVTAAVEKCWNLDEFFSSALGLTFLELPTQEKEAARLALTKFITAPFSEKSVASLFRSIEIQQTQTRVFSDTQIAVRLHVTGNKGRFNGINTLLMQKSDGHWLIIDQRQGNSPSMRVSLTLMWAQEGHGFSDALSAVLNRVADETAKEAKKKD